MKLIASPALFLLLFIRIVSAQQLAPELIQEIRRGPSEIKLPEKTVTLPIVGSKTLPLVEVTINGKGPFRLLIDFGSNVILLDQAVAQKSNSEMLVDRERNDIMRVKEIRLGKAVFKNVVVGSTSNLDVDGVLGFNFFGDLLVTLNYPKMKLQLQHGQLPPPDGRNVMPYELQDRMPFLPVMFGSQRLLVNFDTGAVDWLVVPKQMKDQLQFKSTPQPGPAMWNNQTGTTRVEVARLTTDLTLGRYTVRTPRVHLDPSVSSAFFGSALLQHFILIFDISNKRVRLQGPDNPINVPNYHTFGIGIGRIKTRWEITDVIPNSEAEKVGIRNGDLVLSINQIEAEKLTQETWKALQTDAKIVLTLQRSGQRSTYELSSFELGN